MPPVLRLSVLAVAVLAFTFSGCDTFAGDVEVNSVLSGEQSATAAQAYTGGGGRTRPDDDG